MLLIVSVQFINYRVTSVKDVQLFVTTDKGIYGRVHVMEITDEPTPVSMGRQKYNL